MGRGIDNGENFFSLCDRLSQLTGQKYRLPTEAEWEYACRAVNSDQLTVTSELTVEEWNEKYHQPFHFGETITSDLANYRGTITYADEPEGIYREETTPVGMFPPNAFGLYDLHGNVLEWCEDDYHDNYESAPTDGSAWIDKSNQSNTVVVRGGSWLNPPDYCRSAYRYDSSPAIGATATTLMLVFVWCVLSGGTLSPLLFFPLSLYPQSRLMASRF